MAYTALYRKFRPLTFEEIVGQEHITRTLKNQLMAGRVGHAYLFNGCRGTGKTSAAKILARAVNCLNPQDGEPCNECEICKAAISGSLTDIVEMDAASNNSVEDIRLIRDEVNFLPTLAKYRVYIIDEVHMLSTGAFNALLKTLEEPPSHVKFILATTEPQKLPATILSRCQRFDFKKIDLENIVKRLKIVCNTSNIDAEESALKIVASLSEGAMRDALSILERCLQDGENKITEDKVKELVGIPKLKFIEEIVESILDKDIDSCLKTLKEVINDGKDQNNFLWEVIKYVKDVLLYKVTEETGIYSEGEKEKQQDVQQESSVTYESKNIDNSELQELQRRLFKIESFLSQGGKIANNESNTTKQNNIVKSVPRKPLTKEELKSNAFWKEIINKFKNEGKMGLYTNLLNTTISEINDMTIGINFVNNLKPLAKEILERPENMQSIAKELSIAYGKEMRVKLIDNNEDVGLQKSELESLVESLDIPIDIIE